MSRKHNYKYHDHDDRGNSSHQNTRKVSFKNHYGRVQKSRRQDNKLEKFVARLKIDDEDVDMAGGINQRYRLKGNQRFSSSWRNLKAIAGSINSRLNTFKPPDWYKVKIFFGSKYERNELLQMLLKFTAPTVFIPICYSNIGSHSYFYIDDIKAAQKLEEANKKINLPDGHKIILKVHEGRPPNIPIDAELKEKMKRAMAKRYFPENKALNLSNFAKDPEFVPALFCPLSRPAILRAALQIVSENIPDIYALDLTGNKIQTMDDGISLEFGKLKNLRILHLGENNVKNVNALNSLRGVELTELVLKDNPVVDSFTDSAHFVRYVVPAAQFQTIWRWLMDSNDIGLFHSEIRKRFPKLIKLDNAELPPVITFDLGEENKLPTAQASFMCHPEGRAIVREFLSQYFALFDSDKRSDLIQAYHENSYFSQCSFHPLNQAYANRLNNYLDNRNLLKIGDYPRRKSRLRVGKNEIVKYLKQLPKTQHDLSSFVVDLVLFTPSLINLNVNGVFREPSSSSSDSNWPVRHFSRTFLIVPVGQGFCIINDSLFVTQATEEERSNSFQVETQNTTILQSPSSSQSTSVAQAGSLDDTVRLQMVQTLAAQTGMNLDWSKKCLDETQWNFERAVWTFTELQKQGTIPQEAFAK